MSAIIKDFFQLGSLRFIARFLKGLRGLFIIVSIEPSLLGEYTIWLLFIFYFSFLDFGILKGLEKDLSHYRGSGDDNAFQETASKGWSTFFYLSTMASVLLGVVTAIVFKQWLLPSILTIYLIIEKLYRAQDTNLRIYFRYKECGIADLIQTVVGFILIYYCLPRYGIYSIFPCFTVSSICAIFYFDFCCRIKFQWSFHAKEVLKYIQKTFSLALMFYSFEMFNAISMTVVAIISDKETLGYYAFAFRIFQICLGIFPFLISEVMRTRMYFHMAEKENKGVSFQNLMFPMSIYGLITSIFWLVVYWWTTFIIFKFVPEYKTSIVALNILILSLLPLGISKISSDYLCSRIYNKMMFVNCCWGIGIILQIVGIFFASRVFQDVVTMVPIIYVFVTTIMYSCVVGYASCIGKEKRRGVFAMAYLLAPLAIAFFSVFVIQGIFGGAPSLNIANNIFFSGMSIIGTLVLSCWLIFSKRFHRFNKHAI